MSSVTKRIADVKQPRGGYIKPSKFTVTQLDDGQKLNPEENIHASTIGMVVDYMTRFMNGADIEEAFKISITGAGRAVLFGHENAMKEIKGYLNRIKGLDDQSIVNACKCVTFDVWLRNAFEANLSKTAADINLDDATIQNIRIMVERGVHFFKTYGPITKDGFTFEYAGYTKTVDTGDGDFLTADTLWDFKVLKKKPTSKHTLQLLMYWIMGQHSGKPEFKGLTKLGIFNPRLNAVYLLDVKDISEEIIQTVEDEVICYD